jgi:hypothetical protein
MREHAEVLETLLTNARATSGARTGSDSSLGSRGSTRRSEKDRLLDETRCRFRFICFTRGALPSKMRVFLDIAANRLKERLSSL